MILRKSQIHIGLREGDISNGNEEELNMIVRWDIKTDVTCTWHNIFSATFIMTKTQKHKTQEF